MAESSKKPNRQLGIAVVWLALFCDYLLMTLVIPIFPSLGVSEVEVGVLFSAKAAVQVLFSPIVARVVDGYGLKPLMIGLFVELVSSIGFTFSEKYSFWFVMRAIQGLASAAILSSGFLHVQQLHEGDNDALGNAMGTVITGIITGVMVGPPLGGLLFELGRTVPFWTNAGFIGVAICFTVFYDRRYATMVGDKSSQGDKAESSVSTKALALLRDKHVLIVLFALMLANAAISCLEATVGLFLEHELGMEPGEVGLMYMVTAFPSVVGSKLGGWLGNRFGRWKIIMLGMVLQGGFYALGPKDVLGVVVISFIGMGMGMGFVDGCAPALLSDVGQLYHDGTGVIFTLQTAAIQIGFIIGPVGGSALMQGYSFQVMSIVLGAVMVAFAPALFANRGITDLLKAKQAMLKAKVEVTKDAEASGNENDEAAAPVAETVLKVDTAGAKNEEPTIREMSI